MHARVDASPVPHALVPLTVAEYERIANPSNSQPIILERRSIEDIRHSMHTKECYVLSQESKEGLRGCSDDMCSMILPEECWTRALQLGPDVNHSLLPPPRCAATESRQILEYKLLLN